MIEQFHFLRPWWLLLLLPLCLLVWQLIRGRYDGGSWRAVVDNRLLPHLLSGAGGTRRNGMRWLLGAVAVLAIVALAGPTWEKLPQPVYQKETALVILLDLSRSMNAADIKPSRLVRARHKITDILNLRIEGQTALVVYAADAFAVTPLTSDVETIKAMLPDLETTLMPAQGSRAERAFRLGLELFQNAGIERGDLLLVSDGVDDDARAQIEELHARYPEYRVSVLAVGTPEGGPMPQPNGGFLKAADGSILISELQEGNLRDVANAGGGVYATISADDIDINTLTYLLESSIDSSAVHRAEDRRAETWREFGPWLLLVALPFASLAFRRGVIWLLPLWIVALPPDAHALDWNSLWQNDDQRAIRLFEQGDNAAAARLFDNPDWKAASQYRAGDYQGALGSWSRVEGDEALYNRGNALARLGRYSEALDAYDRLLKRNPQHEDALYNKRAIEDFLQQQRDRQQQQQQQGDKGDKGDKGDQSNRNDQGGQRQNSAGSNRRDESTGSERQSQAGRNDDNESPAESPPREGQADQSEGAPPKSADGTPRSDPDELARLDEQMSAQAAEQWLRKIPDDPGGLLQRKFRYQYRQRGGVADEAEPW
ncbi:MAG: VWA domain-containing protein [Gammaproteobacteria bacterium]